MTANFESFYHGTAPRLLRYAYGLTGDATEAQDFTQEAYARAWQRWHKLQDYDNPEAWLRLVVTRLATDRWRWLGLRHGGNRALSETDRVAQPDHEQLVHLVEEIKKLPLAQRRAIALHYLLDRPVAEIAAETGASPNTVKSWLSRGRTNLADRLAEAATTVSPPAIERVTARARQRRRHSVIKAAGAYLAAAGLTATAALFAFTAVPAPDPIQPDVIVRYGVEPRAARVIVHGNLAYMMWLRRDGVAMLGAVETRDFRQAWPPVHLGNYRYSLDFLGSNQHAAYLLGDNNADGDGHEVVAIDPATGQRLWRRASGELPQGARVFAESVVVAEPDRVMGLDPRSGRTMWTMDGSTLDSGARDRAPILPRSPTDHLVTLDADGNVLVSDPRTGARLRQLPDLRLPDRAPLLQPIGDWLYYATAGGQFMRVNLAAQGPPQRLATTFLPAIMVCGELICMSMDSTFMVVDPLTGGELWRRQSSTWAVPQVSATGIIINEGTSMFEGRAVILDYTGRDITPAGIGARTAVWVDDEHLLLERRSQPGPTPATDTGSVSNAEAAIYDLATGEETPLGQIGLRGGCGTTPGRYICPAEHGFTAYTY